MNQTAINKHTIWQAAQIIQAIYKTEVVMIEYEDGSGHKFNFRLKGQAGKQFINLKNIKYGNNN
jgi:hypothetical protein